MGALRMMTNAGHHNPSNDRNRAVLVLSALCFVDNLFQTCIVAFVPLHTSRIYYHVHDTDHEDTMYSIGIIFAAHSVCYILGNFLCRTFCGEMSRRLHLLGGLGLLLLSAVVCMVSDALITWMIA